MASALAQQRGRREGEGEEKKRKKEKLNTNHLTRQCWAGMKIITTSLEETRVAVVEIKLVVIFKKKINKGLLWSAGQSQRAFQTASLVKNYANCRRGGQRPRQKDSKAFLWFTCLTIRCQFMLINRFNIVILCPLNSWNHGPFNNWCIFFSSSSSLQLHLSPVSNVKQIPNILFWGSGGGGLISRAERGRFHIYILNREWRAVGVRWWGKGTRWWQKFLVLMQLQACSLGLL